MSQMPRVVCFTSDNHNWCLGPFCYAVSKYMPDADVTIVGFTPPTFPIPYPFVSMGDYSDYPFEKWSNAAIKFLESITDELIIFMLEDYFLIRPVDQQAITYCANYMLEHPDIARCDLTVDRLYAADMHDLGYAGRVDIITNEPLPAYTCSLQPGIWRRTELLRFLRPDESPHDTEIAGTRRMIEANAKVIGTRQCPVKMYMAIQRGKIVVDDGNYGLPMPVICKEDRAAWEWWMP